MRANNLTAVSFEETYKVDAYVPDSHIDVAVKAMTEALDAWVNDPERVLEQFGSHYCISKFFDYADKLEQ